MAMKGDYKGEVNKRPTHIHLVGAWIVPIHTSQLVLTHPFRFDYDVIGLPNCRPCPKFSNDITYDLLQVTLHTLCISSIVTYYQWCARISRSNSLHTESDAFTPKLKVHLVRFTTTEKLVQQKHLLRNTRSWLFSSIYFFPQTSICFHHRCECITTWPRNSILALSRQKNHLENM